jgi:hypothetical protein
VVIVSVEIEGDLNSQYDKSALPSYSEIALADIFACWVTQRAVSRMQMRVSERRWFKWTDLRLLFCCRTFAVPVG